jgi:TRAP-type C4-dicarboxylate transport system permease small subunit
MVKFSETATRWAHYISGVVLLILMGMTALDVFLNLLFRIRISGYYEMTEVFLIVLVFFAMGYTQQKQGHVSIEFVYERLSLPLQKISYIISCLVQLLAVCLMTWRLYAYGQRLFAGGYATAVLDFPLGLAAMLGTAGLLLYVLAVLADLVSMREFKALEDEGCLQNKSGS